MAGMPGVNAKQFAGDPRTRRSSNRVVLPPEWRFSTSAAPGKSLEILVLDGAIELGDITLSEGGYAYLPSGSFGMDLSTTFGAVILYFLDDIDPRAVIGTPLVLQSGNLEWQALSDDADGFGMFEKELRSDPGSGAVTRLLRIEPGAVLPWRKLGVVEEGYLLSGVYQHSECVNGEARTSTYTAGGYFMRPAGAINGGPQAQSLASSVWLLRTPSEAEKVAATC
jgi:quercetin dioxygenase-like cupin family protein